MGDLEIAKAELLKHGWNLVIVKEGKIVFETDDQGIKGLLDAVEEIGGKLEGSSIADRVVGLAAAFLCLYARAEAVYGVVASEKAVELLRKHGVRHEFGKVIPMILERSGTEQCPFERLALEISSVEEAYSKLKKLQEKLVLGKS